MPADSRSDAPHADRRFIAHDLLTLCLRLCLEDSYSHSPETHAVLDRWRKAWEEAAGGMDYDQALALVPEYAAQSSAPTPPTTKPETAGSWEERCAALYQVIGALANAAGVFETSDSVNDALDVACGRGDVENLLPWPKAGDSVTALFVRNDTAQPPASEPVAWRAKITERGKNWIYYEEQPRYLEPGEVAEPLYLRADGGTTKPEDRYSDPLFVAVNAVHEKDERQRMHDQGVRDGLHPPVPPKHKPVA